LYPWGTDKPYFSYADYNRRKFGKRVQKISVNGGFTCPNRDGKVGYGGCTYCNNDSFSPKHLDPAESIRGQVKEGLAFMKKRYKTDSFVVYFQAYSNTYAPLSHLKTLYEAALDFDEVIGLTIGTRPDCVDREILDYLSRLAEKYYITIEYGLESMHDETLKKVNRGHSYADWQKAVALTQTFPGIYTCAHLIFGLPGETREMMLQNAEAVNKAGVNYLKLHQLHIVKDTVMAVQYRKKPFPLFSFEEYLRLVVDFLERLDPGVAIQRLFGEAHPRILIAPHWGVSASQMTEAVIAELNKRNSWQGKYYRY
jgi:radical SAM protein (TIGR01212 family)